MRKLQKGKPLNEVKGSIDYTLRQIAKAFRAQFRDGSDYGGYPFIMETFADYVIVRDGGLPDDVFYHVPYELKDGKYVFTARSDWEQVELTYTPKTESADTRDKQRFIEVFDHPLEMVETEKDKPRRLKAIGITADVVNANGRRYPASVLREAVTEAQTHLHESFGQGRFLLLGEAEHPSSKGGGANIAETVVKWDTIDFDGRHVLLEGELIPTQRGKDILALVEAGVYPRLSQRANGRSRLVKEGKNHVEVVESLRITGYDLVALPSDPNAGITLIESEREEKMDPLTLDKLRAEYPELVRQIEESHDAKERKKLEDALAAKAQRDREIAEAVERENAALRQSLGLKDTDDLQKALDERNARLAELEAAETARQVREYIEGQTKDLKYPKVLKEGFLEAVTEAAPKTIDEAKAIIIAKRKECDKLASQMALALKGHGGVQVLGSVLESETGVPEYARGAHEITEGLVRNGFILRQDAGGESRAHQFARQVLDRFDAQYRSKLMREARELAEAETTADLNLPYSVSRAIIMEAVPQLVAPNVFDFGVIDTSTTKIFFEDYAGESGVAPTVSKETKTAVVGAWVAIANKRVIPGTVVITNNAEDETFVEGTDFAFDYEGGRFYSITGGAITAETVKVTYTYNAIRKGENAAIERAKATLSSQTLEMVADRLAAEISTEAIVFSRSQLGWDARGRTIAMLIERVKRHIDQGIFYLALAGALTVASNSGGTYDRSDDADGSAEDLVRYIGVAKTKIVNRYYEPTAIVCSYTNADLLSNWTGFKRDGFPNALLNSAGFAGSVKGLPIFQTTQFSDDYILVVNREMVIHRVMQPMTLKGPFPSYSNNQMLPMEQYYVEEFNGSLAPVSEKASYVKLQA